MSVATINEAIEAIANGEFVVVVDDEDRENEGDLIIAGDAMTPEKMGFMVRYTSGVVCLAAEGTRLDELRLPPMVTHNTESLRTAFTISIDSTHGTTTGISAADRSATVRAFCDPTTSEGDFNRPGHIFPLRYHPGGVLRRAPDTPRLRSTLRDWPVGIRPESYVRWSTTTVRSCVSRNSNDLPKSMISSSLRSLI